MSEHFTEDELTLMKGKYASLARKYDITTTYVKLIADGKRKSNSKLSKLVFIDIRSTIELFRPLPVEKTQKLKNKIVY